MGVDKEKEMASCYQCAGILHCYGNKSPDLDRKEARSIAADCRSLHRGFTTETVNVIGYTRGLSRKNAEKMVLKSFARWCGYKTIEPVKELPTGIHNRLAKEKRQEKENLIAIG